jgi:hypothetical protein
MSSTSERVLEQINVAMAALVAQPMAVVMAVVSAALVICAMVVTRGVGRRLLALGLAVLSAIVSWMMASHWRWPGF